MYSIDYCFVNYSFWRVYLVEHQKQDANITDLGDAFWWAVVTIATV